MAEEEDGALFAGPQFATVQNAYVVPDLEAACSAFHGLYGVGPFIGGDEAVLEPHVYRGEPAPPIRFRGAFVQSGDLNVELLEVISTTKSAFNDMRSASGGPFLHHVAAFCKDYRADVERFVAAGCPVASAFRTGFGVEICYVDARPALGHMIELYPEDETIRAMYQATREAARDWDGKELIIPWSRFI